MGYGNLPICIAKTQYSLSDDAKNLECDEPFEINVRDVELKAGAGFIVVLAGKIMTMPGLPKIPAAESIDIDENRKITGNFKKNLTTKRIVCKIKRIINKNELR